MVSWSSCFCAGHSTQCIFSLHRETWQHLQRHGLLVGLRWIQKKTPEAAVQEELQLQATVNFACCATNNGARRFKELHPRYPSVSPA